MKFLKAISIFLPFFIMISFSSFSQNPYNYPYPEDSINLIKGAPDKATLPFDKPFYLVVNHGSYNFDISRVTDVFAYKIKIEKGQRKLFKEDVQADIKFVLGSTYDTADGKLSINFPALKPNQDFDISIHLSLSAKQRFELLSIVNEFSNGHTEKATEFFNKVKKGLTIANDYFQLSRTSFNCSSASEYYDAKKTSFGNIINGIEHPNFSSFSFGSRPQIKDAFVAAGAVKFKNDILYLLYPKDLTTDELQTGTLPLSSNPGDKAETLDIITRLQNITASLTALNQIKNALWQLSLKTNDCSVQALLNITNTNITNLQTNQSKLKNLVDNLISVTDDGGDTYQAIWIIGSNKNYNLSTKGGSILSTEVGITNLSIRNNSNKIQNIQKLYSGIDIFFRSVDRNLPVDRFRAMSKYDHLSSRRTIFQHLSLFVGLTFGDFDQSDVNKKDFQNLFSGMSLLTGPSYRFCKAFRFSVGTIILRRNNPNPLITGTILTTGCYASLSVDFDFISTISNVTSRILK